jgi:hypothetical protein
MVKPVPGPDRLEKGLRLGCGGMLGLLVVAPLVLQLESPSLSTWVGLGVGVLVFALLALRYGDRFWTAFADWWRTWWPFWP